MDPKKRLALLRKRIAELAVKADLSEDEGKELAKAVADAEALKAQIAALELSEAEQAEEERKAKEAEAQRTAAAVEAAKAEWEKEAAKSRRLPFNADDAPVVGKYGYTRKFDNLDAADLAFTAEVLKSAGVRRSEALYRTLALKLDSEKGKEEYAGLAVEAMKASGVPFEGEAIKADEINYSTLASYGDEWVVTANSSALWEQVRMQTGVVNKLPSIEVPQGAESIKIPLESTDPVFYKVAQATGDEDTGGLSRPLPTAPSSRLGTANNTLSVGQMGARVRYTGTLEEDSIVPFVPQLRAQLVTVGAEYMDHVVIDGDTATTASTNINDIAGTPAGTEAFLLVNGFRKIALGTSGRNRSGGTPDEDDFLATMALLGTSGIGADPRKTFFLADPHTNRALLRNITALKTADVYPGSPTIQSGMITSIWGFPYMQSFAMGYVYKYSATSIAGYENRFNTVGKIDLDTATNNSTGSLLLVRPDRWFFGWKRRMTMESVRHPEWDGTEITSWLRFGLLNRDTVNAAAITYNLTL